MAAEVCKEGRVVKDEAAYVREQYKKLMREKDQYISLDEYCAKREIE